MQPFEADAEDNRFKVYIDQAYRATGGASQDAMVLSSSAIIAMSMQTRP